MADERKFKFISPGVFINEIDRSQFSVQPDAIGPVIIGRATKGPSMVPVKVSSLNELISIFGDADPGTQQVGDVWREGNRAAPLYGLYAAKAALIAGSTPITFVRLAGVQSSNSTATQKAAAGWYLNQTTTAHTAPTNAVGAYGLYVLGSNNYTSFTGALGAVIYSNGVSVFPSASTLGQGMNRLIANDDFSKNITLVLSGTANTSGTKVTVSFDSTSPYYIRNNPSLNLNPRLIGSTINGSSLVEDPNSTKYFWIGESYERTVTNSIYDNFSQIAYAVIPLVSGSDTTKADYRSEYRDAHTPWFIAQHKDTPASFSYATAKKLFKFVTLNGQGDNANKNIKVSITNIKYSPNENNAYGSFDVLVRDAKDLDTKMTVLERYSNVNLNPQSPDYIANRIGDQYLQFDSTSKQVRVIGDRPNKSNVIRVVMSDEVENGGPGVSDLLPFGYYGVPKVRSFSVAGNATSLGVTSLASAIGYLKGGSYILSASSTTSSLVNFPEIPVRVSASDNGGSIGTSFFGASTWKTGDSTIYNPGWVDYTRFLGADIMGTTWSDNFGVGTASANSVYEYQTGFSLDEISASVGTSYNFSNAPSSLVTNFVHVPGGFVAGNTFNAISAGSTLPTAASYKNILKAGVRGFTAPFFGGFDGLSIFEREPLRNSFIDTGDTVDTNYVVETYDRALTMISDPEFIEYNVASVPGLTNTGLTNKLLTICEERGDSLAVIDLESGYVPPHEQYKADPADRKGDLVAVLTALESRNLNNSYGAAYYPWVTVRDDSANSFVKVPPSVVAIGVLANTERVSDVWFAPAGFNRGGLSNGAAGLPVVSVETKLSSKDRDDLYDVGINPIASFPSEGLVVFGQKTLQSFPQSALSRINVRRLLIFLKKGISQIASTVLFEQNVQATWSDFKTRADNFLTSVKVRLGLDDFKVVLDETTTTPDLVDRNIMYAKVFVKPTRTIEYIALDFIITRTGASFED